MPAGGQPGGWRRKDLPMHPLGSGRHVPEAPPDPPRHGPGCGGAVAGG